MDTHATKLRILETARRLFHRDGYHATGIATILKEADVNSGTLYHFFQNKEALLLAVLDFYLDLLMPAVMQPAFDATPDPVERVFAVLRGYRARLIADDFKLGCPIGNLALELGDAVPAAREKINRNFDSWSAAIARCLDVADDQFPSHIDRLALAGFVLTVMEGGMMLARAQKRIEPFDAAVRQLRNYFDLIQSRQPVASPLRAAAPPKPAVSLKPQPSYRVW